MIKPSSSIRLLVICIFLSFSVVQAQDIDVIAHGGRIFISPVPVPDFKVVVSIANGSQISRIRGSVSHPYGDGPFEVVPAAASIVQSASVTPFPDRINFDVQLSNGIYDNVTELFIVRAIADRDTVAARYPKSSYPYPLQWFFGEAWDWAGQPIEARFQTDPILFLTDLGTRLDILPMGFAANVESITIVQINDVPLYFPFPTEKESPDRFFFLGLVKGLSPRDRLPLTFEVVLADGTIYVIRDPHFFDEIRLSPPSEARYWELYP